ncbi:MAG TPA: hypothetical protein VNZ52_08270 [Candidatus Thermoplasmatota archaeon]|nr:hypothetical protein [Candidatus Thermoplasmatota archaeon]
MMTPVITGQNALTKWGWNRSSLDTTQLDDEVEFGSADPGNLVDAAAKVYRDLVVAGYGADEIAFLANVLKTLSDRAALGQN